MLHPSYTEIIDAVNSEVEPGEQPVVIRLSLRPQSARDS